MDIIMCLVVVFAFCCSTASGQVRLVDGSTPHEGRVEVFINDAWGLICHNWWGLNDARVVCRQLGYPDGPDVRAVLNGFFGNADLTQPIVLDRVDCLGTEASILLCPHDEQYVDQCWHRDHAGVVCRSTVNPPMQIRLVDARTSTSSVEGRLEVFRNGIWGTVCDQGFNSDAALVVCRMMGYGSGNYYSVYGSFYGTGSSPMLISRLQCTSSDSNLTTCLQLNSSVVPCASSQAAGVMCNYTSKRENITLRLEGPSSSQGTVEVFISGQWRRLCLTGIDLSIARVICRQLGLPSSLDSSGLKLSFIPPAMPALNTVSMYGYSCNGREPNIGQCTLFRPIGSYSCLGLYELGITCYAGTTQDTTEATEATTFVNVSEDSSKGNVVSADKL